MNVAPEVAVGTQVLDADALDRLFDALRERGWEVHGPTVRDGAIVLAPLSSAAALPDGWTDEMAPGRYRLQRDPQAGRFGYTLAVTPWKRFLFPPDVTLVRMRTSDGRLAVAAGDPAPRRAFIGVRACELAAIAVQDRVFLKGPYVDPVYRERRESVFLVAVECRRIGPTCFCASMGTGPRVTEGFDLRLVELRTDDGPAYAVEAGSERGLEVLESLPLRAPTAAELAAEQAAPAGHGRALDTADLPALLTAAVESPRWDQVAKRCLACGNCTQVCPTCFCFTFQDASDLAGTATERVRRWDSCFTPSHSYIHGGSIRPSVRSRYRQWLTHKLGTWHDQFGVSGCVGCGRCIAWCPAGIDLTEEVGALRSIERRKETGRADT